MREEDVNALLRLCREGDDAAKARFFSRYQPYVRKAAHWFLSKAGDVQLSVKDADDLAQEIMTKILGDNCRRLSALRDPNSIDAWLTVVVRNHVASHLRSLYAAERAFAQFAREGAPEYNTPAQPADRWQALKQALDALPPQERLLLQLYYSDGLRYADIAKLLALNPNTVASKLRRAKEKLRPMLENQEW